MLKLIYLGGQRYRGFQIAYANAFDGRKLHAIRSSLESEWIIGNIGVKTIVEVIDLAKECIDYQYKVDVKVFEFGRALTIDELPKGE